MLDFDIHNGFSRLNDVENKLNLKLSLIYKDDSTFTVVFKGKTNYWLGLAFGRDMRGIDMHVAEFTDDKNYILTDTWSQGDYAPPLDTSLGGINDLKVVSYGMKDGQITLEYTRKLNTGDKYDKVIAYDTQLDVSVAWGPLPYGDHKSRVGRYRMTVKREVAPVVDTTTTTNSTTINTNNSTIVVPTPTPTTNSSIIPEPEIIADDSDNSDNFWLFHGISLTILWSLFNFIGYIFGRFNRHLTWWIWMHRLGSILTSWLSIGIMSASIKFNKYTDLTGVDTTISLHVYFGLIFFALIILQTLMGTYNFWNIYERAKYETGFIHKFKVVHKYLGITMTCICYIMIFTGFIMGDWPIFVAAIVCSVLLSIILFLEIKFYLENNIKKAEYITELNKKIKNDSEKKVFFNLVELYQERKNKKFVLYDNYVCDVENYIASHPGGAMMIEENLYTDIGRFMTGTQAYSNKFKAHDHLFGSHQHLMTKLTYGELKDNHGIINNKLDDDSKMNLKKSIYLNDAMIIQKRKEIAENTFEYTFACTDKYKYTKIQPGVFWIGRHYAVSSHKLNKTRYYSICVSLEEFIKHKHSELLENVFKNEDLKKVILNENEIFGNTFNLYIKRYPIVNTLSDYIFNLPLNTESDIIIRGPNGVGLNLFENRLTGTHVIFSAGTGVIPFLDLVAFTLRYAVYKTTKLRGNFNPSHHLLLPEEDKSFDQIVSDTFRLIMFVSFPNPKAARLVELCEELDNFNHQFNLNLFSLHKRISSENGEKWNKDFFEKNLKEHQVKLNKAYIVGPVSFMDEIKADLLATTIVSNNQIILV